MQMDQILVENAQFKCKVHYDIKYINCTSAQGIKVANNVFNEYRDFTKQLYYIDRPPGSGTQNNSIISGNNIFKTNSSRFGSCIEVKGIGSNATNTFAITENQITLTNPVHLYAIKVSGSGDNYIVQNNIIKTTDDFLDISRVTY